jgi:hypothetical protein
MDGGEGSQHEVSDFAFELSLAIKMANGQEGWFLIEYCKWCCDLPGQVRLVMLNCCVSFDEIDVLLAFLSSNIWIFLYSKNTHSGSIYGLVVIGGIQHGTPRIYPAHLNPVFYYGSVNKLKSALFAAGEGKKELALPNLSLSGSTTSVFRQGIITNSDFCLLLIPA